MSIINVRAQLEAIWKSNPYWKRFVGSQFSAGFSEFISQMVYRCEQYASRRLQESFLSKATNKSSILAAAEDRAYVGLKVSPSKGLVTVTNKSKERVSLALNTALLSDESVDYLTMQAVDVLPQESKIIPVSQLKIVNQYKTVDVKTKWLTIMLDRDLTAITHSVDVYVNDQLWSKHFKFRNTDEKSHAYMEFYTSTQQLGIRFGNGINGMTIAAGDRIRLKVWTTQAETTLLDNQPLTLTGANAAENTNVNIITKTTITGGAAGDTIEDVRNGALYLTSYDHQLAWDGDYRQFIHLNVGGLIYLDVWGEAQQEKVTGFDVHNINKIYFTAYSMLKSDSEIKAEVLRLFSGREGYNEQYVWKDRIDNPYTLIIKGKVLGNGKPEDAEYYIKQQLNLKYGKNSKNKPHRVPVDEIWNFVHDIKAEAKVSEFTLIANNLIDYRNVGNYNYLDIDKSSIKFDY